MKLFLKIGLLILLSYTMITFSTIAQQAHSEARNISITVDAQTKRIVIKYDLLSFQPDDSLYTEILRASGERIRPISVSGDVGKHLKPGSNKVIYWDIVRDKVRLNEDVEIVIRTIRTTPPSVASTTVEKPIPDAPSIKAPQINWVTASAHINQEELLLRACILNNAQQIQIELNDVVVTTNGRGATDGFCREGISFSQQIRLREGQNKVVILATNEGGKTRSNTLTVWYDKPISTNNSLAKRYAFVVGNSTYLSGHSLGEQPRNDASDIAARLRELGFTVDVNYDLNRQAFNSKLYTFSQKARNADVVLFFFAGHGVMDHGENYLIPTDAVLTNTDQAEDEAHNVNRIIGRLQEAQPKFCFIMMDACRSTSFREWHRDGIARGFVPVNVAAAPLTNTYLMLATQPGQVAQNGVGHNGMFTTGLLKALQRGRSMEEVKRATIREVLSLTNNAQRPQAIDEITDDFQF